MIKINQIYIEQIGRNDLTRWAFNYHKTYNSGFDRDLKYFFEEKIYIERHKSRHSRAAPEYKLKIAGCYD